MGVFLADHIPATVGRRNLWKLLEMVRDGEACLLKTIARQGTPCPPGTSLHRNVMKERAQIERVHGLVADFLTQAGNRSALAPEVRPRRWSLALLLQSRRMCFWHAVVGFFFLTSRWLTEKDSRLGCPPILFHKYHTPPFILAINRIARCFPWKDYGGPLTCRRRGPGAAP